MMIAIFRGSRHSRFFSLVSYLRVIDVNEISLVFSMMYLYQLILFENIDLNNIIEIIYSNKVFGFRRLRR